MVNISPAILASRALPKTGPFPTLDPFLFCVYHLDHYPPGNTNMEAPRRGNGQDFSPELPYRMYHGEHIPGFPQHPHRGFETITATMDGWIDHTDSVGNAGRYGHGDVQWMTAGKGVVHSEMFPLVNVDQDNPLRFFQIWLNLPSQKKMVEPSFVMLWHNNIPTVTIRSSLDTTAASAHVTLWAGDEDYYIGKLSPSSSPQTHQLLAPPDSWAFETDHDVAIMHVKMEPGSRVTLPKAKNESVNRSLFYVEGSGSGMMVDGISIGSKVVLTLDPCQEVVLEYAANVDTNDDRPAATAEFLLLQGQPIAETVAQYGPFVMNSQEEVDRAFADYRRTQFGGWPWPRDDVVFPRDKGRFALVNGKETTAPTNDQTMVLAKPSTEATKNVGRL